MIVRRGHGVERLLDETRGARAVGTIPRRLTFAIPNQSSLASALQQPCVGFRGARAELATRCLLGAVPLGVESRRPDLATACDT